MNNTEDVDCNESNCNYYKYIDKPTRELLKKHKATMWSSGCEDSIYGIEMNPRTFSKFLKSYTTQLIQQEANRQKLKLLDEVIHQSTVNLKFAKAVAGWAELRKKQMDAEL